MRGTIRMARTASAASRVMSTSSRAAGVAVHRGVREEHRTALGLDDVHPGHLLDPLRQPENLERRKQALAVVAGQAADDRVSLPRLHEHGTEVAAAAHETNRFLPGQALALPLGEQVGGEFLHTLSLSRVHRIDDGHIRQFDAVLLDHLGGCAPGNQQDGVHDALVAGGLRRLQDLVVVGLGEDDPLRVTPGTATQVADEGVVLSKATGQHPLVVLPIPDGLAGDPALHGRLRDGRSDGGDQAGVHRLGDDEVHPETEAALIIGLIDLVGHVLLGEGGDGAHGGHLHLVVDGGGADIHGPAEDEGESEDVVDLVGMVAPSGGHDDVGAGRLGLGVGNLRVGLARAKTMGFSAIPSIM